MQIPSFLLRKLYMKGSLANVDDGFVFKIKNSLAPGTATNMDPIKVDDVEYPLDALTIKVGEEEYKGASIAGGEAFPIKVGVEIELHVKGDPLSEGEHKIDISIETKEAGKLAFDVKDAI
jgi:hypothetical protein